MLPVAPGRSSTMKFWPNRWLSDALINRISVSVLVPAANGHRTVTGRVGHGSAARAGAATATSQIAAAANARTKRRTSYCVIASFLARRYRPLFTPSEHERRLCQLDSEILFSVAERRHPERRFTPRLILFQHQARSSAPCGS